MKWSPARWSLACLVGCALIAVTFLPAGYDTEDSPRDYWMRSPIHLREDQVSQRLSVSWEHATLLNRSYKAALDAELANRAFGATHADAAKPVVYYGADIPAAVRARVQQLIDNEIAARGEWTGHGAVGILVRSDTGTTLGGNKLPAFYDRDRSLTTVVLPPTAANGNHCVTVVRLRHHAFTDMPAAFSTARLPLDGCAFTDAFGAPGPQIANWLQRSHFTFARRLSYSPSDTALKKAWAWYDNGDDQSKRCRGGIDSACVASAVGDSRFDLWYGWRPDYSVAAPDASDEVLGEIGGFRDTFMESLARDLGSARFQRMWRSQKPLAEAYFDETGEPLANWIRARQTLYNGPYKIGPMQPPSSAFLTLLSILILAAITIRFAPRPYKI